MAKDQNKVVGVFPAAIIKSKLFGTQIRSLPFADYAGPLLSDEAECTVIDMFLDLSLVHISEPTRPY